MQLSVASDDRKKKKEKKNQNGDKIAAGTKTQDTGCDARHLANSTRPEKKKKKEKNYFFFYSSRKWLISFVLPLHVWLYTKCVKKKQGRSGRTALHYCCMQISDTVRDFGGKVQPCSRQKCPRKTFFRTRAERVRGGESSLPVPFATMCQKNPQNLWDGRRAGETCHFVQWSTSLMNKQPLHCALRRRYDGIQTRGVNIMRRDTDEQRWEICLFFFGGGGTDATFARGVVGWWLWVRMWVLLLTEGG